MCTFHTLGARGGHLSRHRRHQIKVRHLLHSSAHLFSFQELFVDIYSSIKKNKTRILGICRRPPLRAAFICMKSVQVRALKLRMTSSVILYNKRCDTVQHRLRLSAVWLSRQLLMCCRNMTVVFPASLIMSLLWWYSPPPHKVQICLLANEERHLLHKTVMPVAYHLGQTIMYVPLLQMILSRIREPDAVTSYYVFYRHSFPWKWVALFRQALCWWAWSC